MCSSRRGTDGRGADAQKTVWVKLLYKGAICNRRISVSGHRYPIPHLGRGVKIVGWRWGISPHRQMPYCPQHIWMICVFVHVFVGGGWMDGGLMPKKGPRISSVRLLKPEYGHRTPGRYAYIDTL